MDNGRELTMDHITNYREGFFAISLFATCIKIVYCISILVQATSSWDWIVRGGPVVDVKKRVRFGVQT